jgi:hypothetical protein
LHPGRGQDDDEAHQEEKDAHRKDPVRKGKGLGEDIGDLKYDPARAQINGENLDDPGALQAIQQGGRRHDRQDRDRELKAKA